MRRTDQGCTNLSSCDVYDSGHASRHEFGCGFAAAIRIKAKYFYITLTPTEDKDDTTKDAFHDKLDVLYNRCLRSDIKILVGDFNAKVGIEGIFGPTVGKTQWLQTGILRCRTKIAYLYH